MYLSAQDGQSVCFAGALPPPVTGMTLITKAVVDTLRSKDDLNVINWSNGTDAKGLSWRLRRLLMAFQTTLKLATGNHRGTLYYPSSAGLGLYYDLLVLWAAKLRGITVFLHHHSYAYIDSYDWRMAVSAKLIKETGVHCVYCTKMASDFSSRYGEQRFAMISPIVSQFDSPQPSRTKRKLLKIGHLSNLTFDKGVDQAIATQQQLVANGIPVKLVLAGPCMTPAVRRHLDDAMSKSDSIEYRGPVYGDEKRAFFEEVDVFIFPTRYRNESWGIVLTEALQAGCPIVATERGCIPHIIKGDCGLCVPTNDEFVSAAVQQITAWHHTPETFHAAQKSAVRRYQTLEQDAKNELTALTDRILGKKEK